ncbi:MAG: metallophosphoesterase [Opitutales bacterium]
MSRTIVIGDVHGCADEFEELLETLEFGTEDRIIQVGDLVNRGPNSHRVLEIARTYSIESILGNHELRLLTARRKNRPKILKRYDRETIDQLSEEDWQFLEKLPPFIHMEDKDTVVVHGGFLPDQPWEKQSLKTITSIQVIDEKGKPAKHSDDPDAPPWADSWNGPPFVVYGHTPRPHVLHQRWSIGIDTGCVYGGYLTAYIIETGELVQTRAHQTYAHSKRLPDPV